jgi:hypothetical protein
MEEVVGIAVLAGAIVAVYLLSKKYAAPASAAARFRMDDAWRLTERDFGRASDEQLSPLGRALGKLPASRREDVRRELLDIEARVTQSSSPVKLLRASIMDAAALSLYASHILLLSEETRRHLVEEYGSSFSDHEMLVTLVSQELKYTVLRSFAQYHYDDASERDWFDSYMKVARGLMRARSGAAKRPADREEAVSGVSFAEYMTLLETLKQKLLDAPSHTPLNEAALLQDSQDSPV